MQALQGITTNQFLAAGQEPLIKFEIFIDGSPGAWINICDILERVSDSGFEQWLSPTDLKYWTESISGSSTINRESSIIHGGRYSLNYYIDATRSFVSETQPIMLIPGDAYSLTFWYKGSETADILLHLSLVDSGNNVWLTGGGGWEGIGTYDLGFTVTSTTTWTKMTVNFNAHADYSSYNLAINSCPHGDGVADAQVYIDDFSIKATAAGGGAGNYLESTSISLGGAAMTPNPVAGKWNAMIFNEDSIFLPQHPTSPYKEWIRTGRKVKISVGARYDDVDYYWPRIIGYMDVPKYSFPEYKIAISGGDYMKRLRDTELKFGTTGDNYWGDSETYPSIPSDGMIGAEIYDGEDAMDAVNEEDDVDLWVATKCTFVSFNDGGDPGQPSGFVGRMTFILGPPPATPHAKKLDVGDAVEGHEYRVRFKHRSVGMSDVAMIRMEIWQASGMCRIISYYPTDDWAEETFYFTALDTGVIEMRLRAAPTHTDVRWDQFSIQEFTPYWKRYYELLGLDPTSKGPYYVTLDGEPVWQGEEDEGWWYVKDAMGGEFPHPAEVVFFDPNKTVPSGVDVVIYYFTQQIPEEVVEDLLVLAGIDDALEFTATGKTIDNVWFKAGTTCLDAIRLLCEFCDYRFYFKYDGTPAFKPKPTEADPVDFAFTDPKHIASAKTYQDEKEIKNRIVIEGVKQAEPVSKEETAPSELKGELADDAEGESIDTYGERTLTIKNHLFQTQDSIDHAVTGMCKILLDEYKDPKWYTDLRIPFNPVPLELGDTISWKERINPDPDDDITKTGIIRDIKINQFSTIYKCVLV